MFTRVAAIIAALIHADIFPPYAMILIFDTLCRHACYSYAAADKTSRFRAVTCRATAADIDAYLADFRDYFHYALFTRWHIYFHAMPRSKHCRC